MLRLTAKIWFAPAKPANPPEMAMPTMMDFVTLKPAYFAARGFVPTVRRFKPQVVLNRIHQISQAKARAMKKPRWKRMGVWKNCGISALFSIIGLMGIPPEPSRVMGPESSHSVRRKAIQFIMMVLMTSCPPVLAFNRPGIKPHKAPPKPPARKASGMWIMAGRPLMA